MKEVQEPTDRQSTSNEQQATSNKQRATRNEQQATSKQSGVIRAGALKPSGKAT
jgi:hypothetical protein